MDKFCPIFPFQQHDEDHQMIFQNTISTFDEFQQDQQQYIIGENLMITNNHAFEGTSDMGSFLNYNNTVGYAGGEFPLAIFENYDSGNKKRQHKLLSSTGNVDFYSHDKQQKNIIHKEVEKQRRNQMANLYASLKSLLPLHSAKGRGSTSDLIHEAENHIRLKQKSIDGLTVKRDNLKTGNETTLSLMPCRYSPVEISVTEHLGGMEILISIDMRMNGFQLSRVLEFLLGEGLCVVSCVCTRIKGRIHHTIQTEVSHLEVTDAYDLKKRLLEHC